MAKPTLLCVEDDKEALEDTVYLLKRHFNKVYSAIDGKEALESYNLNQPDIILLDINIPYINGLEVASKIREDNKTIPIIFLTAHSEKEKLLKAINLHVESYIIKPFKISELKENIVKAIEKIEETKTKISLSDDFVWNKDVCELFYKDQQISLTKNEISLIEILILNRSRFLTAQEISLDISCNEDDITGNNIVQLISRLKKKVKKQLQNDKFFIENIYGGGYRIK
jgi:DNA-binding response OmpR family regulator